MKKDRVLNDEYFANLKTRKDVPAFFWVCLIGTLVASYTAPLILPPLIALLAGILAVNHVLTPRMWKRINRKYGPGSDV